MPAFPSNPLKQHPLHVFIRKHPSAFGIPFLVIIVGASFGLSTFTQTRYDLQDQKVKQVTKEEELGLKRRRHKIDIREEYFKLSSDQDDEWENKRVPRLPGQPEWGLPSPVPVKYPESTPGGPYNNPKDPKSKS